MQPWTLAAALLCLSCCVSLSVGNGQYTDTNSLATVGTVDFKGSKLRVFEIDGAQFAEPGVSFDDSCSAVKFSRVYMKYQLVLPISIDANALRSPVHTSKKVGHVTITGLKVKADKGLSSGESGLSVMAELKDTSDAAELVFLCSSFLRCRYLSEELVSNPSDFGRALKFEAVGRVGDSPVKFGVRSSANWPSLRCDPHRWVVFQRRVDGSLSFAQNWDAYVKGFGNPKSNYWMGLDQLSAMTVTSTGGSGARCGLRIETEDLSGKKYSAEFNMFEVLGREEKYRLRVGLQVGTSELGNGFLHHNDALFSTFDRDNDKCTNSCSRLYGYGGWWYHGGHYLNLNGAYTTDRSITDNPIYDIVYFKGRGHVPMKHTVMKFKCN